MLTTSHNRAKPVNPNDNRSQSGVRHVHRALALQLITYPCRDKTAFTRTYKMLEPANSKVRRVIKDMTLI